MTFTHSHFLLLMACMLKDTALCGTVCGTLQSQFFVHPDVLGQQDPVLGQADAILFEIIARHHTTYLQAPDLPSVRASYHETIQAMVPDVQRRVHFEEVFETFATNYAPVADPQRANRLCQAIVAWLSDVCVFRTEAAELLQGSAFGGVPDDLSGLADQLRALANRKAASTGTQVVEDVFATEVPEGVRRLTGVPWLDALFGAGRGMVRGSVCGIVAAQGHGKTTMGIVTSVSAALQGEYSLLALAEEGLTPAVKIKIMACTTGVPTTLLEGVDLRSVSAVAEIAHQQGLNRDQTAQKIENLRKYLKVLDLVELQGGFEEIESTVTNMAMAGRNPENVYIDWAGIMVERIMSMGLKQRQFTDIREAHSSLAFATADLAERHKNLTFISQQMTTKAAEAAPGAFHGQYVAMDCRSWSIPFKYMMVLGNRCTKTGVQRCCVPKARNDPPDQSRILRLRGEIGRFEDVSDVYEVKGKSITSKARSRSTNAVPSEKKGRRDEVEG